MASFKIGDKVEIRDGGDDAPELTGEVGTVAQLDRDGDGLGVRIKGFVGHNLNGVGKNEGITDGWYIHAGGLVPLKIAAKAKRGKKARR